MNFQETLDKLCLMAIVPHHPRCPSSMDARLKCECNAAMVKLKVDGCRMNLSTMYEAAVKGQATNGQSPTAPAVVTDDSPPFVVTQQGTQPPQTTRSERLTAPNRDVVENIQIPDFAKSTDDGPKVATVPVTKRTK